MRDFTEEKRQDAIGEAVKRLEKYPEFAPVAQFLPSSALPPKPVKETNPKDSVGIAKAPFSTVSAVVWAEVGVGMMEGARKYGRHNYRAVGVRASVYYDATLRHLTAWWEGEDIDPDSNAKLSHVTKAIASLTVLRDSMIRNNMTDDRPPAVESGWLTELNQKAKALIDQYPDAVPAFTEKDLSK